MASIMPGSASAWRLPWDRQRLLNPRPKPALTTPAICPTAYAPGGPLVTDHFVPKKLANRPVQHDELTVDRPRRAHVRAFDGGAELRQQLG